MQQSEQNCKQKLNEKKLHLHTEWTAGGKEIGEMHSDCLKQNFQYRAAHKPRTTEENKDRK